MRLLSTSLLEGGGRMLSGEARGLDPAKSILGYREGDRIAVREADFDRLAKAFFAAVEAKFS